MNTNKLKEAVENMIFLFFVIVFAAAMAVIILFPHFLAQRYSCPFWYLLYVVYVLAFVVPACIKAGASKEGDHENR